MSDICKTTGQPCCKCQPVCGSRQSSEEGKQMNNDLISRTALAMRFIDETHSYSSERILQLIRRQPTAFNVEKVVEQLKEAKGTVFIDGKEMYNEDYFIDIDDAIEIVKGGRIDGNG